MDNQINRRNFLKLAAVGASGAVLAACAPSAPSAGPTDVATGAPAKPAGKIVFSSYTWSGYEASMNQVIEQWRADKPDTVVETMYAGWDDYWQKLTTLVAAGTPPDIGIGDYGRVVSYAKSGILLPIDDLIQSSNFPIDDLLAAGVAQYRWREGDFDSGGEGGKLYGVPSDAAGMIFVYNKTMFDAAGVAYPTDDWTWDDFVEAGKKLTKGDEDIWGTTYPYLILDRGVLFYQTGGSPYSADYTKAQLTTSEVVEAYKWAWDLIYTHKIAPEGGRDFGVEPFMSGRVAMQTAGVWLIADYATITEFEWDMAMLPRHPITKKNTTTLESDGWWIFNKAANPELSWDLISFMVSPEGQAKFASLNFIVPPSLPSAADAWYSSTPPEHRIKALENILESSGKFMGTYFDRSAVTGAYNPIMDKAFNDGEDILKVLEEANQVMQEEMDKAWENFNA
jgi:multiple sugar transport system substrate-binding protein